MGSVSSSAPSDKPGAGVRRRAVFTGVGAAAALWGLSGVPANASTAAPAEAPGGIGFPNEADGLPIQLAPDSGFNYSAASALGSAGYGTAEVGEVLTAVAEVNAAAGTAPDTYPTYAQAYTDTFLAWGDRLAAPPSTGAAPPDDRTTADRALRASNYNAQALFYVLATNAPGREEGIYDKIRANWDRFVTSLAPEVVPFRVPYQGTTFPAWLFRPTKLPGRRPTVILTNGSDGQSPDMWTYGAAAALTRGWNAVVYEGPGQGEMVFKKKIPFSPRWEQVITPIIDYLIRRRVTDVDPRRIALTGLSMGGNLVARAAAFEHRIAALVCEPGVYSPWLGFPAPIRQIITTNKDTTNATWQRAIINNPQVPAEQKFFLAKRFEPFGANVIDAVRQGQLPADIWTPSQILLQMDITPDIAAQITCPTLVLDYDGEQFYPGQPQELFNLLTTTDKQLVTLRAADGAQLHCSPMAPRVHNELVFSWLDSKIG